MIKNKPTLISAIRRANRLYQCVMVLAFGILLGGCCAIPDFQTDHERYVNYMNSLVGKHAADLYSGIRPGYQKNPQQYFEDNLGKYYVIVDYKGEQAYRHVYPPRPRCTTVEFISVASLRVLGWEYTPGSDPEQCKQTNECRAW